MNEASLNPYPAPGEVLAGKYRIDRMLGEGGMGAVARATHLVLHTTHAVKFMNPQFMTFPGAVERFINEGRASGALEKFPHIAPVQDIGSLPSGAPYLVMECLSGMDLADLLARDGPSGLPIQRATHFLLQILRGLQAAHGIGIIHRDMKPSNCFVVNHEGEEDYIKLLDFGISKIAQQGSASLTQTNSALGTPLYMSPEQARSPRDVDARSDIYSVGVILYELLSGRTPFFSETGEFTEILFQLFTADPPPIKQTRPDLPDALAAVVHKALAREVVDRYGSALEMAEALLPFASDHSRYLVDRMRNFKAPVKESLAPAEGLPTSLAAFSQLQSHGRHGTDVMVHRPNTDIQRGGPVTEVLMPEAQAHTGNNHTAVLAPGGAPQFSAAPAHAGARARPEDALGRTQLGDHAQGSAVRTDLGAARDVERTSIAPARSPLVYVAVAGLALVMGVLVVFVVGPRVLKGSTTANHPPEPTVTVATSEPPPAVSTAPVIPTPPPSAEPTTSVAVTTPSAVPSASVKAVPKPKDDFMHQQGPGGFHN